MGIEKVLTTFSIPNKTFPKMDLLMCALRAHINRTHLLVGLVSYPSDVMDTVTEFYFRFFMQDIRRSQSLNRMIGTLRSPPQPSDWPKLK